MPGQTSLRLRIARRVFAVALFAAAACTVSAHAALTVLVGEPFGSFGTLMPTGHTTIYLDRVCADGPLKLRMCQPGEPHGVAIARYNAVGHLDWIATPILDFLYATDDPSAILASTTPESVWELRQTYRRRYLATLVPDGAEYAKPTSEWWESSGMAYTRRLWGYQVATTQAQDELFVAAMNALPNDKHLYRLRGRNCADFAAQIVNTYFPHTVHTDHIADMGIMSPKQVARCLFRYGQAHPETNLKVIEVPQVPGTLRRSRPVRFGSEAILKTKRYVGPLAVIQPELVAGLLVLYLDDGRWQLGRDAEIETPEAFTGTADSLLASQ